MKNVLKMFFMFLRWKFAPKLHDSRSLLSAICHIISHRPEENEKYYLSPFNITLILRGRAAVTNLWA